MELMALIRLNHQNVVVYVHAIASRNLERVYLIMELAQGDVSSHLKGLLVTESDGKKKFTGMGEEDAKLFFRDAVYGLEYLHSNWPRIAHRDIKPDNMLISTNSKGAGKVIKLSDYGLARFFSVEEEKDEKALLTSTLVGTNFYRVNRNLSVKLDYDNHFLFL